MAEILPEFPPQNRRGCVAKYLWDEWLDGKVWKLTAGVDFRISVKAMQSSLGYLRRTRNIKIRTAIFGDDIVIQAIRSDSDLTSKGTA